MVNRTPEMVEQNVRISIEQSGQVNATTLHEKFVGKKNMKITEVEEALWDIKGKSLGAPIYEMPGGRCHDKLWVYGNAWYRRSLNASLISSSGQNRQQRWQGHFLN